MSKRSKEDCKCHCDMCFNGLHNMCEDGGCAAGEFDEYNGDD